MASVAGEFSSDVALWTEICGWKMTEDGEWKESRDYPVGDPIGVPMLKFSSFSGIQELEVKIEDMGKDPGFYAVSFPMGAGKSSKIPIMVHRMLGKEVWVLVPTEPTARALVARVNECEGEEISGVYPNEEVDLVYISVQEFVQGLMDKTLSIDQDKVYLMDEVHSSDCATRVALAYLAKERVEKPLVIGMTASQGGDSMVGLKVKKKLFGNVGDMVEHVSKMPEEPTLVIATRKMFPGAAYLHRGAVHAIGRTYPLNRVVDSGARVVVVKRRGKFAYRYRSATTIELDQMAGRVGRKGVQGNAFLVSNVVKVHDVTKEIVSAVLDYIEGKKEAKSYLMTLSKDLGVPVNVVWNGSSESSEHDEGLKEKEIRPMKFGSSQLGGGQGMCSDLTPFVSFLVKVHDTYNGFDMRGMVRGKHEFPVNPELFPGHVTVSNIDLKLTQAIIGEIVAATYTEVEYTMILNVAAHWKSIGLLQGNYELSRSLMQYVFNLSRKVVDGTMKIVV